MKTTNRSSKIFLGVKCAFSLFVLFIINVIIHEGAHYFTALVLGIPIAHFTWFDLRYLAPVFISGATKNTIGYKVVSYAGGLVTGVLLLATLVLKKERFKQSLYRWFLGFYIAAFGFWQICQGILEGAFHDRYITDATNILSLSSCVGYAFGICGLALYWVFMPGVRSLIAKAKYSEGELLRRDLAIQ